MGQAIWSQRVFSRRNKFYGPWIWGTDFCGYVFVAYCSQISILFQKKRQDREVDNLFRVIENITEIKDTEIERCKLVGNQTLNKANADLEKALDICSHFGELEETYKQVNTKFYS